MADNSQEIKRHKGIYLLPNLFTTAGLFAGFFAIVAAMDGRFEAAAVAVFIAMVMDGIDGRIARLTNTQSDFGKEYDSLADMISFGIAPALVIYTWALQSMGKIGWLAAFLYTAAAALRLARFNTQVDTVDKGFFQGLSSPAAAALLMGMVWVGADYQVKGEAYAILAFVLTVAAGLLMVSNVRYHSFKNFDLKGKVPFVAILVVVLIFVFISISPSHVLFAMAFVYAVSGVVLTLWRLRGKQGSRSGVSKK
ncbi:MAG TPA: CDP-diacylglycerol--serine O-phosphatidyltransferase [Gammaproteobacteria bacterium]|nr:CDP-diacylglycerol--serine O-phosphatidyltransferase [Gammaproteobacteria bacterium]